MSDPITEDDWQQAMDAAWILGLLGAAVQYGLCDRRLKLDLDRIREITDRGRQQGFEPSVDLHMTIMEDFFGLRAKPGETMPPAADKTA